LDKPVCKQPTTLQFFHKSLATSLCGCGCKKELAHYLECGRHHNLLELHTPGMGGSAFTKYYTLMTVKIPEHYCPTQYSIP
jgi:hypothetical protein